MADKPKLRSGKPVIVNSAVSITNGADPEQLVFNDGIKHLTDDEMKRTRLRAYPRTSAARSVMIAN